MITIEKQLSFPNTYPLERIGSLEELLFFDIETTGLSGDSASVYLIGCTYWRSGSWNLIQWFADTPSSEPQMLHDFFEFLKNFKILIHFNGDSFDIPFLLKRCARYRLDMDFSRICSVDIYRKIKPYRKLLGLESLKQKAIEQFLGVTRKDIYSGGQLIAVYESYLHRKSQKLYELLLLHNEDDLKGMPGILPILNYPDLLENPMKLIFSQTLEDSGTHSLELIWEGEASVPVPFHAQSGPIQCSCRENRLSAKIALYEGTLRHFYPNYKDYYYLIYEDNAIHKSVGAYVDASARIPATVKNCYTRKEGCFLPQFAPLWEPVMKHEVRDRLCYVPLENVPLLSSQMQPYLDQLLIQLGLRR